MNFDARTQTEFEALRALSARLGADPMLVQAAGGNTSIKVNGVLWIKASGTWLMHALDENIFVPVRMAPLMDAFECGDPAAEKAKDFCITSQNPRDLRPSIETTVHSVIAKRIVVHVHCVETIALAARRDTQDALREQLAGLNWAQTDYFRPGLPLSRGIAAVLKPETDVLILGNHGLVVAADNVADADALLGDVCNRLRQTPRPAPPPDLEALQKLAEGSDYELPGYAEAHGVATDPASLDVAKGGSFYPDHVIFLGAGSVIAGNGENAAAVASRIEAAGRARPASILFPTRGVLMRSDASAGAEALARCLSDVTARIPPGSPIRYFSDAENNELLNWDAEKYRQALDAKRAEAP